MASSKFKPGDRARIVNIPGKYGAVLNGTETMVLFWCDCIIGKGGLFDTISGWAVSTPHPDPKWSRGPVSIPNMGIPEEHLEPLAPLFTKEEEQEAEELV